MEDLFSHRVQNCDLSSTDKDWLKNIASDKDLRKEYIDLQNTLSLLELMPTSSDTKLGIEGYERFLKIRKKIQLRKFVIRWARYAASVALFFFLVSLVTSYFINRKTDYYSRLMHSVYVPGGQRSRVTLSDGTVVWLNAQSTLKYPSVFTDQRQVELVGEAFFEVSSDASHPFIVKTKDIDVKAVGTQFNVSCYPENDFTLIALIEGKLMTQRDTEQAVSLLPNQQVVYTEGIPLPTLTEIGNADYFLWKEGVYSFVNEPLKEIVQKLERYYDVQIVMDELPIVDYEYTVKFRQQDGLDVILRMLQKTYPFRIEKRDDIIYLKK